MRREVPDPRSAAALVLIALVACGAPTEDHALRSTRLLKDHEFVSLANQFPEGVIDQPSCGSVCRSGARSCEFIVVTARGVPAQAAIDCVFELDETVIVDP